MSQSLTICTNYAHDLSPWPTAVIGTSGLAQHEQQLADGICQFCTSLSISRADSCCAVASSVACFDAFAAAGTPASNPATTTANGVVGSTATSKSHSGGDKVHMVSSNKPFRYASELIVFETSGRSFWSYDGNPWRPRVGIVEM